MDVEVNGQPPFLDMMIHRKGASLIFGIYRKATHSDLYLQWTSHPTHATKMAVMRALVDRAFRLCSESKLEPELKHIREVLKQNGFPDRVVRRYIQKKGDQREKPEIRSEWDNSSKTTESSQKKKRRCRSQCRPTWSVLHQIVVGFLQRTGSNAPSRHGAKG